jgi:outer membrane protein OmpA-like peptidoglycan-associated protein
MQRLYFILLLSLVSTVAWSQHSSNAYRKLADSLYAHHHYHEAAQYYQRAIKKAPDPASVMLSVARSYGKVNAIADAELWFAKAKASKAAFTHDDIYLYTQMLMMQKKRAEAEMLLKELLVEDPNAARARQMLGDILNFQKYYADSSKYHIVSLSSNTAVSEFAPAYYKEGIVYTAATQEKFSKKKYHWDNSNYLNLYYTKRIGEQSFEKPILFEKDLNTKFHDGPASFYDNYQKMIVNRNQSVKSEGKENTWYWHLALFDATNVNGQWQVTALPFDQPPYSFAHPFIIESGSVLYFISDKPGGYGGTDIYRAVKTNGVWGKAFNLGPTVNTSGNETFPYFVDNTLYFSSNGHGGLGGLDIFKTQHTVNGFTPPANLGAPINSSADDFSFITRGDQYNGYFASSRNGNDDLFTFRKNEEAIHLAGHIYDGSTNASLTNANIQIITLSGEDIRFTSDANGDFQFDLPDETAYVLIGSKDGKVGMLSGLAEKNEDRDHVTHQVPVFGDTTRVACVGTIKDESGSTKNASLITIIDETTGKKVEHAKENSVVSFLGEKEHSYRVEIQNEKGDTTIYNMKIASDAKGSHTWSMTLKESVVVMNMAAHVFDEANNRSLAGAEVKVITFDQPDQELTADANGVVEFQLVKGTAFMVIGSKDNLTGMYSGVADPGSDKASVTHPVPAHGDPPPKDVPVVALITNAKGEIVDGAMATVTDRATGDSVAVKIQDGVLTFLGERGKEYNIDVTRRDHPVTREEISIPTAGPEVEKLAVTLEGEVAPKRWEMIARVFKEKDNSPLVGASVKVISFTEPDLELTTNADGLVEFSLPDETAYMVIGSKEGYVGMNSGTSGKGADKASTTLPVPATAEEQKELPVVALITNKNEKTLSNAIVIVKEKESGERVEAELKEGVLSFNGEKGKNYDVTVSHPDHHQTTKEIRVPATATEIQKTSIALETNIAAATMHLMAARVFKTSDNSPLPNAKVTVISFTEPDLELTADENGIVDFTLTDGTSYMVVANKDGFVGMHSGSAEKGTDKNSVIHPVPTTSESPKQAAVAGRITDGEGNVLEDAKVKVTEVSTGKEVHATVDDGILRFHGEKEKEYKLVVENKGHESLTRNIKVGTDAIHKVEMVLETKPSKPTVADHLMAARVFKASDQFPLSGAEVKIISFTEPDIDLLANAEGVVDFKLPDGTAYMVVAKKDGFVGMHSGMAETGMDKASVIHPIPAVDKPEKHVPVVGRVTGGGDNILHDAIVTVTEKSTGKAVKSEYKQGLLTFSGEKGKSYSVSVEHDDHHTTTEDIHISHQAEVIEKMAINMEAKKDVPVSIAMAARVFKVSDQSPLSGAEVKIISFTEPDIDILANAEGLVDFNLPDGTAYMVVAKKDALVGMHSGTAERGMDKASITHPIPVVDEPEKQVPVVGRVTGRKDNILHDAIVTVTEKSSGKAVKSEYKQGLLTFSGEKGKSYSVNVEHDDHHTTTEDIHITHEAEMIEKKAITMEAKNSVSVSVVMGARIFKAVDKSPLSKAKVTIISFTESDIELLADNDGLVDFKLPEGTAYMVVGTKDGYAGMHSGVAEKGSDKASVIHPVAATSDADKQLPVVAHVTDAHGQTLTNAHVTVTERATGKQVQSWFNEGLVTFLGEKGRDYNITAKHSDHRTVTQGLSVPEKTTNVQKLSIAMNERKSSVGSVLIMTTSQGATKAYVHHDSNVGEIVEQGGVLYLTQGSERRRLGEGSLSSLSNDPKTQIIQLGLSDHDVIRLQNIYFDFNQSLLDDEDKRELKKVNDVLRTYPDLKLVIRAHADNRGHDEYNLSLSKRRARVVGSYIKNAGVKKERLITEALGESAPVVPCASENCSEEEHQKNRRAEFVLDAGATSETKTATVVVASPPMPKMSFEEVMTKYGDKSVDGVVFKIVVGAYRYNRTLTFKELADLGTLETVETNGITYYYLGHVTTLAAAEKMRLKANERGVKDAWVVILYKGQTISLARFTQLAQ